MSGKTGIFLQARLGSTRLSGKALLDLEGKPVISHAMEALSSVKADFHVLLTDEQSRGSLEAVAAACGFRIFAGSAEDVLNRYVAAAELYGVDTIIRATGDNPLVSSEAAELIRDLHLELNADYSGFDGMPLGTGVEVLRTAALIRAEEDSREPYDHEHVSPYLYKNPGIFMINRIPAPDYLCLPGASVTLDTEDDYAYLQELFRGLYCGRPLSIPAIIPWLKKHRRSG